MLELLSLSTCQPNELAMEFSLLVNSNGSRLARDYPSITRDYATPPMATERLEEVREQVRRAAGRYDALAVRGDGHIIGMVTYSQRSMWVRLPGRWLPTHMNGPLVAGWLDQYRPQHLKGIGVEVLRLLAGRMTAQPRLSALEPQLRGTPWTVIRPDNAAAIRAIEAVDNGFGGFVPIGDPRDYSPIDGVKGDRQLFVANYNVQVLAATPVG